MKKDINKLTEGQFDLVIVGGGIHGAVLTLAVARAGYWVAFSFRGACAKR